MSVEMLQTMQVKRKIFGGTLSSMTEAITAPNVYPRYTTLPSKPNL